MQRYSATSCGGGVGNSAVGATSARDTTRSDSNFPSSNFPLNQRRTSQLNSYRLKCDKEPLNSRLGPPDFYPQALNCPEETLTREYVQSGYKETVEGLEEPREISLSQLGIFTKPVVLKCKEAIRKNLRAINESRAQKRKAGQVYGVPLYGPLLAKPGVFPEQRAFGEEFKKKWIEGLSQQHKRLCSLADHVPHGHRKKSLFDVLIRHNVPLLRATWFIKVTYLNQDKPQFARTELWTKDVIEYLQYLLDDFFSRDGSHSNQRGKDQSPRMLFVGSVQHKSDPASVFSDGEEPSIHFKWWYMVGILQWHHAEGLLLPSHIVDWIFTQLQEKDSLETLQLLLPIIFGLIETVALSQTYVRNLVEVALHFLQEPSLGGSDLVDNSRRVYTMSVLVEMLRYLIVAVPDTFVALDCFPLPALVASDAVNGRNYPERASKDAEKVKFCSREIISMHRGKKLDTCNQFLSFDNVISSIQKHADNLTKAVSPGYHAHGMAKAVLALDRALTLGDVRGAYNFLFGDLCDRAIEECWIAEVSPCLRSSLKWIGTVSLSFVFSIFFLCEWATCDFRDCRTEVPPDVKFTGEKDFSQVYIAILLLKLKIEDMHNTGQLKNGSAFGCSKYKKNSSQNCNSLGTCFEENVSVVSDKSMGLDGILDTTDIFQSPGPVHDILVCWIDRHEVGKREGFKRLQLLIIELIRAGIFYPQAYVRQLIVSGIMDKHETMMDLDRHKRHYQILKQLPGPYVYDALEEAHIAEVTLLLEAMHVYSNERQLVLHGLVNKNENDANISLPKQKYNLVSGRDGASPASHDQSKNLHSSYGSLSGISAKSKAHISELKSAIAMLLHLPNSHAESTDVGPDESHGNLKRPNGSIYNRVDATEGTPGCEECKRAKRQKSSEGKSSYLQGFSPNPSDDEDSWWVRKGNKSLEPFKVDPPLKPPKHASRGRQKIVRKTQSLAQLADARIEGSQGASTSHVCDNRIICPHHRTGMEGEVSRLIDGIGTTHFGDIVSIVKSLKKLRLVERRTVTAWLITLVRQLVEGAEKAATVAGQCSGPFPDDRGSLRWRLGEDELSAILYLMDASFDLVSTVRFLLWLLPKILASPVSFYGGRTMMMLSKNVENHTCEVGEAFILSSIRRYEHILVASDLIPEALSASMHRAAAVVASNGKISGSAAFLYARSLLKKYGSVDSVAKWEKNFKTTCDQKLLSELESVRSLDGEFGFSLGVPTGLENLDDYFRQKISGRLSRVGLSMKDIVQRHIEDVLKNFYGKEIKILVAGTPRGPGIEKWDDGYQIAQQIILGLMECMQQSAAAAQEGDPSLVSSAVSAIVYNVGQAIGKIPDVTATSNYPNFPSAKFSLNCVKHILHIHMNCLCLLKEALGERQSRAFEISLATEASSVLAGVLAPGKAPRNQYQPSPEAPDSTANLPNEILNSSTKVLLGRATKVAAAVSALVIGAVVRGVASLERIVTVLRLKEGLDALQFIRGTRSNSNGISRSTGSFKLDTSIEVYVHWFRLFVGNCRTVSDGLIVELLGEPYILALSRMQRTLPLSLILPPAYSIFALVLWRPYILNSNIATREDIHQLYQSLSLAIGDVIRHLPFRDACLRDTRAFYDLVAADTGDSEFAAMLEVHGQDKHLKPTAFVPLRARLFLNSILDCKMPHTMLSQDDGNWVPGCFESKLHAENEMKLPDQLVHVLDTLQPAKFHWQWVELRLLLNEQSLIEKIEAHNMSLVEAIRSLSTNANNSTLSDDENNFTEIILTRLLVRPDAAPLYSEVVHLFGMSQKESLLSHTRWFLAGPDVLFGRKSIRQKLINIAQQKHINIAQPKGRSTKVQFWKPWGWSNSTVDHAANRVDKRKFEVSSLEEGEVAEEGMEVKRNGRGSPQIFNVESFNVSQQHVTEKALVELVLSCIDQSSNESRGVFASDLIKQMHNIEQQINAITHGVSKQIGTVPSGIESALNKGNSRKGTRGGSPGLGRRPTGATDSVPPSSAALRASMCLRLQFLLRLLPIICTDRERNMRHTLAMVILRLLGSRVVYEDADQSYPLQRRSPSKRESELLVEAPVTALSNLSGGGLFDHLLWVLHGLLSTSQPSWLKHKSTWKSAVKSSRDFPMLDREVIESLQKELDRMQLPELVRWRLQAAMPILHPNAPCSISCQPPALSTAALVSLQSSISFSGLQLGNTSSTQKNLIPSARAACNVPGKSKPLQLHDQEVEIDPWTLLEEGTGSGPSSNNNGVVGGDQTNFKACSWLKGAIRVRRTDLTYIGAVDDDN